MTQRTTLPFLIAESGAASFTAAVTTSPSPARSPRSAPRGKTHESLRAPLVSAPSRIVLIPIIIPLLLNPNRLNLYVKTRGLSRAHQRRAPDHIAQTPPL